MNKAMRHSQNVPGFRKYFWISLSGVAIALAGCTMIPKYQRPSAPIRSQWPAGTNTTANKPAAPAAEIGWRDFFEDPRLQDVIGLALTNNRDLRVAVLNVEATRAQYRIARSALLPDVEGTGAYSRQRFSGNVQVGGFNKIKPFTSSQYSVSLGATDYELDLFGRVRSLKRQALQQYFATAEAREAAQLSLVAEVANQYLAEREFDELLAISQQTLGAVSNYYRLIQASFNYGNTSEIDVRSAEAQVETARANVATYTRQREQARNALELLVGEPLPDDLPKPEPLASQHLLPDLPAGLPSDLLVRRPDIRQAEDQLRAANANIGAARAAFFPRITLTGSAGFSSSDLANLFAPGSHTWSFAPQITVPIFETAYNRANLDLAHVQKRIEIARYEQAIQTAFREVADTLAGRSTFGEELDAEEKLVNAEQRRYDLASVRYRNGVDSYLAVLTAQQDLYAAQQRLIQSRYNRLTNLVSLYKALGGGWKEFTANH